MCETHNHNIVKMKMKMEMKERACELCDQEASLYCASDSAFLCWKCDAAVHHANFLVARHRRHLLCSRCNRFTGIHISGSSPRRGGASPTCRSCSPPENYPDDADSLPSPSSPSSSSSACVSSSEPRATSAKRIKARHAPARRIRTRSCTSSVTDDDEPSAAKQKRQRNGGDGSGEVAVEREVFVKWCRELGLGSNDGNRVVSLSSRALSLCLGRWRALPFKVAAATSFWLGLRYCGISGIATFQNLSRLEVISGVPAKLILPAHAKLARAFSPKHKRSFHLQEGCDES